MKRVHDWQLPDLELESPHVAYLVNLGDYDRLEDFERHIDTPLVIISDTEPSIDCAIWAAPTISERDVKRQSLWYKTHPHLLFPRASTSLWMDSNISIHHSGGRLLEGLRGLYEIATFSHPDRRCVYEESIVVRELDLDHHDTVQEHREMLERVGMPREFGLFETNVILATISDHTVRKFFDRWWQLIAEGSRRDQLSFTPAAYLERIAAQPIDGVRNAAMSPHFSKGTHVDRKSRLV